MANDMFKASKDVYVPQGRHLNLTEIADELIRRNNFSAEERNAIRQAEYEAKTIEQFWRKVEDII